MTKTVDLGPGDPTVIVYQYDIANRIEYVDDQSYTWDDNGNLLSDSSATYTYNHANRLASVTDPTLTASFAYNGLGDRLQQIVNGQTTTYTLDIVGGLTQVLADDTHTYLYGNGRIAQYVGTNPEYFLADVLGSVRQLTDSSGNVTLAKGYQPYGQVLESAGDVTTAYGYTGEWTDSYIKLIYLRSRWYSPQTGRFTTRDTWQGDYTRPLSLNWWNYVEGDPINRVDPSGKWYCQSGFAPLTSDCLSWVQDALDKLETSGTTGKKLVEFFQGIDPRCYMPVIGDIFPHCSSFSNEDLVSDYLGFIVYIDKDLTLESVVSTLGGGHASADQPSGFYPTNYKFTSFRMLVVDDCSSSMKVEQRDLPSSLRTLSPEEPGTLWDVPEKYDRTELSEWY